MIQRLFYPSNQKVDPTGIGTPPFPYRSNLVLQNLQLDEDNSGYEVPTKPECLPSSIYKSLV